MQYFLHNMHIVLINTCSVYTIIKNTSKYVHFSMNNKSVHNNDHKYMNIKVHFYKTETNLQDIIHTTGFV